jgi:hypothetical protein
MNNHTVRLFKLFGLAITNPRRGSTLLRNCKGSIRIARPAVIVKAVKFRRF